MNKFLLICISSALNKLIHFLAPSSFIYLSAFTVAQLFNFNFKSQQFKTAKPKLECSTYTHTYSYCSEIT